MLASKALRMEQQNKPMDENLNFADVIHSIGTELILCGNNLQSRSKDIHMVHHGADGNSTQVSPNIQIVSQPNNNLSTTAEVSAPENTTSYHQLKHSSSTRPTVNATDNYSKYCDKELRIVLKLIDSVYARLKHQEDINYIPDDSTDGSTSESDESAPVITKK